MWSYSVNTDIAVEVHIMSSMLYFLLTGVR